MKAPVGLLSDRTVLRSKMEGLCPDKFAFVERSGTMKAPVGLLSDRTVLRQQDGGALPRQVRVCKYRNSLRPLRVQIPPFVTCGDIFPRPGEVFPLRGSFIGAFRQLQRARPSGELAKPSGFD